MQYAIIKRPRRWPWAFIFKKYRGDGGMKLYGMQKAAKRDGVVDPSCLPSCFHMSDDRKEMILSVRTHHHDLSKFKVLWGPGTFEELQEEVRRRNADA